MAEFDSFIDSLFPSFSLPIMASLTITTCKGMNLMEDKGLIFVKKIDGNSVLGRDGRIRVGDRILSINGKTLEGLSISKVRYVIQRLLCKMHTVHVHCSWQPLAVCTVPCIMWLLVAGL